MNITELNERFESALVNLQHLSGVMMLLFNGFIIMLIVFDEDSRNKHYRKYLIGVQLFSLLFDTFSDFYAPIFIMHEGLIYSDSLLSNVIGCGPFLVIETVLFAEVLLSYFACVYYRRGYFLGNKGKFNFSGRQRVAILVMLQVYGLVAVMGPVYFMAKSISSSKVSYLYVTSLPSEFIWVRNRTSFVFLTPDEKTHYASYVSAAMADCVEVATIAMLAQLILEVKKVQSFASVATRRYQQLAVRSLVLQGTVPSLTYVIPPTVSTFLQHCPSIFQVGPFFHRIANHLSPILWIAITKHTFVSSITILCCSPSYRKKIAALIQRSPDLQRTMESQRRIERTC